MITRDYYFMRERTVADIDTVIIPLDVKDPLTYLKIDFAATNGGTSNIGDEIHGAVPMIEVLDGSRVIQSLSMKHWLAVSYYSYGRNLPAITSEVGGAVQESSVYILFGRYINDPEYYFNPAMFRNPQLRISIALPISATAGFVSGSGRLTVLGRVLEAGAGTYKGFVQRKYVERFHSGTSGEKIVPLFTDFPYRRLYVAAELAGTDPTTVLTRMKLSIDADKVVPFDIHSVDLREEIIRRHGFCAYSKIIRRGDGADVFYHLFDIRKGGVTFTPDWHIGNFEIIAANRVNMQLLVFSATPTISKQATVSTVGTEVRGALPYGTFVISFFERDNPEEYLKAQEYGNIRLILTQGAAAPCGVIAEQIAT